MQREGWPELGSLVVCTVTQVVDFGAFVSMDEYSGKQGLILISRWPADGSSTFATTYEGAEDRLQLLNVDTSRHHIDLSLKDVMSISAGRRFRVESRSEGWKWLEMAYKDRPRRKACLISGGGVRSLYMAMEEAAISGVDALADERLTEEDLKMLESLSKDNVKIPSVDISGYVDITSPAPDGVDVIRKALKQAKRIKDKDATLFVTYIGAPRYRIHVTAPDYKHAESVLKKSAQAVVKYIEQHGGEGTFLREA